MKSNIGHLLMSQATTCILVANRQNDKKLHYHQQVVSYLIIFSIKTYQNFLK